MLGSAAAADSLAKKLDTLHLDTARQYKENHAITKSKLAEVLPLLSDDTCVCIV